MRTATLWVSRVFGVCCCTCPEKGTSSGQRVEFFVNYGSGDLQSNVWNPLSARNFLWFPMRKGFRTIQMVNKKEREVFDGVTSPEELGSFYKAFLESDGHISWAELWVGKRLHCTYWFDKEERLVRSEDKNGKVEECEFGCDGEDQIEKNLQRTDGAITHASRCVYDRDGWRKESWWRERDGREMREVYDYQKSVYRTYDSGGNVIEERLPSLPRPLALASMKLGRELANRWPVLKFEPVGQQAGR